LVYENVVIHNNGQEIKQIDCNTINIFGSAQFTSTSLNLLNGDLLKIKNSNLLKTQGYYIYYKSSLDYKNNITYDILSYNSNDIIYLTEDEYKKIKKIECTFNGENCELIEKVITLNINGIDVQVPALLYRKTN
jgi:hypothetical protein